MLAALGLAGCGGAGNEDTGAGSTGDTGGGETDTPTGEPLTEVALAEFHEAAEEAFCAWQVACGGYGVEGRCRAVNHLEARLSMLRISGVGAAEAVPIDYLNEAIAVGRIEYDAEKAATCLNYVRARTCDLVHPWTEAELAGREACAGVFVGRMGRNGPCAAATECAEASVCGFDPNCTATESCCVGACRVLATPVAIGQPCPGNTTCEEGAYCEFDFNTSMPTVCKAALKLGEACANAACIAGTYCDYDQETPTCKAPKAEGSRCYGDQECASLSSCLYDDLLGEARCFKLRAEGEGCDPDIYAAQCLRVDNTCRLDGTCGPLPGINEACPKWVCQGDLFCSSGAGQRCVPVADASESCGYVSQSGDVVPCSGDHACVGEFESGSAVCTPPSGATSCPVPPDPGA